MLPTRGVSVTYPSKQCLAWLALSLLSACAPNVAVNYDKSTDFSQYHTYGWGTGVPAKNPETDRQIVEAIDGQLSHKGFTKTESNPDLIITYHAATHEEVDYHEGGGYAGSGPKYGSTISPEALDTPMHVQIGTIIVDMYDTKVKRNVWHAVGSDVMMDDPAKTSAEIHKGAVKMFEKFPPR
jgi:Domain of unknown function (DUF4136)